MTSIRNATIVAVLASVDACGARAEATALEDDSQHRAPRPEMPESVVREDANGAVRVDKLPGTSRFHAWAAVAVTARGPRDVWVGAATVTWTPPPEFPGCPVIVRDMLDATYLAHFDGGSWEVVSFPGDGRLWSMELGDDGALRIVTGWAQHTRFDGGQLRDEPPQARWTRAARGAWRREADELPGTSSP